MESQPRAPLATYEDLAQLMDHALLRPDLTTAQVLAGLEMAKRCRIACVTVRPSDIDLAVRTLAGSSTNPGSVSGFPHGSTNTATKLFETRDLLRRGAREIDVVAPIAKLVSREFQHVQTELSQLSEACQRDGVILKITLETAYLTDELKIIACRCCERAEVDIVKTSTGFGPSGYTMHDLQLLRKYLPEEIRIEAEGGLLTAADVLTVYDSGCSRVSTTASAEILEDWKTRLAANTAGVVSQS